MARTYASETKPGETVELAGWIHAKRDLGDLVFVLLRDRSGQIQIVGKKGETAEKVHGALRSLVKESVVSVRGKVRASKAAPGGKELVPTEIEVISEAAAQLPLDVTEKVKAELPVRLDFRALDLRKPRNVAIFKIQSALVQGMEEWLDANGFIKTFTPCIMGAASESGADVFPVIYFQKEAILRQDPQLHRQLMIIAGFDRIYDLGPSWRAELSHTTRHICEYRGCAVEVGFIKDEQDVMRVEEQLVIAALKKIKANCAPELKLLGKEIVVPKAPFPELRFPEIYKILLSLGKKIPEGSDYDTESEKLLGQYVRKKYKTEWFFVNRFPFAHKPFYVMRLDSEPQWARSVDLLYKGTELSSGGQRENRYAKLMENIKAKRLTPSNLEWFTKFFRFGVPQHGGFCIGIERLTMQLLDLDNIREATLFPRDPERLLP